MRKEPAELLIARDWQHLFSNSGIRQLEVALRLWFDREEIAGPRRTLRSVRLREAFRLPYGETAAYLAIVDAEFSRGGPETLVVPIAFAAAEEAAAWPAGGGPKVICRLTGPKPGVLYDALSAPAFCDVLLEAVARGSTCEGSVGGELAGWRSPVFRELRGPENEPLPPTLSTLEQANRSVRFGNSLILKIYRRIEEGAHPELEMGKFLTEGRRPSCVAPLAGAIEYRRRSSESAVVAVLHGYVPNEGDALQYVLDVLSGYFERVATLPALEPPPPVPLRRHLGENETPPPDFAAELLRGFFEMVRLLGKRLGELHRALVSAPERPDFAPEPISVQYQRAIYQSLRNVLFDVQHDLEAEMYRLPPNLADMASQVRHFQVPLLKEIHAVVGCRIHATRIRCHGDCHLHQVLFTGKDFVFIDFEGRPGQSIGERRIKRSPLVDVISMIRSFDYAAYGALFGLASSRGRTTGAVRPEDRPALVPWMRAWRVWTHNAFLQGYLEVCADESFVPRDAEERNVLYRVLLLDKLLLELARELRSRSAWLEIPLLGLLEAVQPPEA